MRKDIKLGGVICLYQILKAAASEITEEAKTVIIDELFMSLADYTNQEQIYIAACLEVIGLLGPCQQSISKIGTIKAIICDPLMYDMQTNTLCALLQLGFEGLR
jgi:hypothetical protein